MLSASTLAFSSSSCSRIGSLLRVRVDDPQFAVDPGNDLARKVQGNIALDLTLVKPLNCAWINHIITYHHRCRNLGGQLVIAGLPVDAADILRTTGLDKKLIMSATREDALRYFQTGEDPKPGLLGWLKNLKAA